MCVCNVEIRARVMHTKEYYKLAGLALLLKCSSYHGYS